jgi:hypothetical protein
VIGGNTTAQIQTNTSEKNEIGEMVQSWENADTITGFLDLSSGDSKYTSYNAKIQESTHVFIADWKQLAAAVKAENSRLVDEDDLVYDILLIDDPMKLHRQLEIYLKFTGGQ